MGLHPHALNIQIASRIKGIPRERDFRKWLVAALPKAAELTLRVVNGAEGRALNNGFRGKSYATNVLTFVYHEKKSPLLMGDIVLCAPVVAREAREQSKTLAAHYAHLTIHGALHLAGLDHEVERAARTMEKTEIAILDSLGFDNPYTDS
ncbi:MAG: rRNA maturation RNase YbeY [Burkholderiales bacterium]|nr:rRNA maturation RNase YbeY [Burkholderiales bacterium]